MQRVFTSWLHQQSELRLAVICFGLGGAIILIMSLCGLGT